ncbi:MAG: multicomponent Na+:H+ antiporter subunit [Clostridiales bacterium]|nr:multicomponent Na+:H+ antiporter subunit [Clostridiales bacterium]
MIPLFFLVLAPILVGVIFYLFFKPKHRFIIPLFQCLILAATIINFLHVKQYNTYMETLGGWGRGIGITLKLDPISGAMVVLTATLFLAMVIFDYRETYMNNLFLFLFLSLEGMMIGIFVSNDLFNIFVMIEVSTIIVSILIMFKKDSRAIYDGMLYMMINVVAMLFFLFGVGMLYKTFGVLDLTLIQQRVAFIHNSQSLILPYAFIMTAIALKAALMPLFSWLPKAHATPSAPSIVSAVLSGLYVKNGVYLFIRVQKVFETHINTMDFFLLIGFLTAIIGVVLAISQKDIKLILAYSTVSQIGLIMMGINTGNIQAYWGAIYHIINHAIFKSTLFLTAGIITETYGTRNVYKIRGLFKSMPAVSIAMIMAIMGITGTPFFNGSISKYWISYGAQGSLAEFGIVLINLGTIISFVKYSTMVFGDSEMGRINIGLNRKFIVLAMGFACLGGGILGNELMRFLFDQYMVITLGSYINKIMIFLASLLIGFLAYHLVIKKSNILSRIRELELDFNSICFSIISFFLLILIYLKYANMRG